MNKTDKIREGQIQIDDEHNRSYRSLPEPMVKETHNKALRQITDLQYEKHVYLLSVTVLTLWAAPPEMFCSWYRI